MDDHGPDAPSNAGAPAEKAIRKLRRPDAVGIVAETLTTVGGAAGGASAAGAIAAAAGATTMLGSTTLAGALGGVFVVTTPVGWVIGSAAVGATLAFGLSRLARSVGKTDRVREEIVDRLKRKAVQPDDPSLHVEMAELIARIDALVICGEISKVKAEQIMRLVRCGALDVHVACARLDARGASTV